MVRFKPSDTVFPIGPEDSRKEISKLRAEAAALRAELAAAEELLDTFRSTVGRLETKVLVECQETDKVRAELAEARDDLRDAINWLAFVRPYCAFGIRERRRARQLDVFIAKHKHKPEPCGTCKGEKWVYWWDDFRQRNMKPCPDCQPCGTCGGTREVPSGFMLGHERLANDCPDCAEGEA